MKLSKRSRWIIVVTVLAVLPMLLFTQVDSVRATFDGVHALNIYLRVETEILQKTAAGQYYDSLFWKHVNEVNQIMSAHPEHQEELMRATFMFVPELEALLNGDGNKAYVSSDHVKSLKAELDWFASMGSPALQEDIQKEQQRLPLDHFIGMTMNEAWDYINSRWTPDMVIEQPLVPDLVVQPTSVPELVVQPTSIPQLVVDQTLVPDSDGKWAYYVHDGIYLEYPASYHIQLWAGYIIFTASTDLSEWRDPSSITVDIWNLPATKKDELSPSYVFPVESILWERIVQNRGFEGTEFIIRPLNESVMYLSTILYNQENQLAVLIYVNEIPLVPEDSDYFALINHRYEYFQHMVESVKIQLP